MVIAPFLLTGMTDSRYYGTSSALAPGRVFRFSPHSYNRGAGDIGRVHGTDERVSAAAYRVLWSMLLPSSESSISGRSTAQPSGGVPETY